MSDDVKLELEVERVAFAIKHAAKTILFGHIHSPLNDEEALRCAKAAIAALSTRNEALLEALEKCRLEFRYYEHCHRLKCTPEGDEKADRNREMADMCAAAISNASTKGSD